MNDMTLNEYQRLAARTINPDLTEEQVELSSGRDTRTGSTRSTAYTEGAETYDTGERGEDELS